MEWKTGTRSFAVACLLFCALAPDARAEPTAQEKAMAQELFDKGRAAMAANHTDEACSDFNESYRIDPGGGSLLNLAVCHEKQGRTASAYAELNECVSRAIKDGRRDREKTAREHLALVTPRLSRLTVTVAAADAAIPSLVLSLDGAAFDRPMRGVPAPADPGEHVLEAKAPGRRTWRGSVTITGDGESKSIEVPELADETLPPTASSTPMTTPPQSPPAAAREVQRSPLRTVGWGAVGVGVAGVAIGSTFGAVALLKWNAAKDNCPNNVCPNTQAQQTYGGAGTYADISTAGFIVAGVGAAVGAILLFTVPKTSETNMRPTPWVAPGGAGLCVGGKL